MKITSFNVRYDNGNDGINNWCNRKPFVFATLKEINSDIFSFQEVLPHVRIEIEDELKDYYTCGCARYEDLENEANIIAFKKDVFNLIYTKTFWLSVDPHKSGSLNPYSVDLPRICTVAILKEKATNKIITVYNTHLDHVSDKSRMYGIDVIFKYIKENTYFNDTPTIITGDFNCTPDSVEIKHFEDTKPLPFKDLVDLSNSDIKYTYRDYTNSQPDQKIDYIYVCDKIKCKKFEMITKSQGDMTLSDHFPVVADISY